MTRKQGKCFISVSHSDVLTFCCTHFSLALLGFPSLWLQKMTFSLKNPKQNAREFWGMFLVMCAQVVSMGFRDLVAYVSLSP